MGTKFFLAASDFQLTAVLRRVLVPVNIGKGGGCVVDPAGSLTNKMPNGTRSDDDGGISQKRRILIV